LKALRDPALEAVVLLKLEGYSNVEIAEKMKYSRRTIQRMLELVKDIWGQYVEE
jgi:DNA-directed RNA polymerase specialized sigma24 family protein